MAYEIDQDEDQRPQGTPAPAAVAPAGPSAPAAQTPADSGSRFVSFDRLLAMNTPGAQATAAGLESQVQGAFTAAGQQAEGAAKSFDQDTVNGISAKGYQGPTDYNPYFADARKSFADAQGRAQALQSGPAGIQALLEKSGQSSDAARYNALFANQFVPQAAPDQNRFAQFDSLLTDQQKKAAASQEFGEGMSRYHQYEADRIAGNQAQWAEQQRAEADAKSRAATQASYEQQARDKYAEEQLAKTPNIFTGRRP